MRIYKNSKKIDHVKLQEKRLIKTNNYGALRKNIADYFMLSKDSDHIRQRSGIKTRVVLAVRVFRFFHKLLT